MPGPSGEACSNCYWWDLDNTVADKRDGKILKYADCCFGNPHDHVNDKPVWEDKWCSEHMNREYGIEEFRKAREVEEEMENEEEAEEENEDRTINLLESIVELLNNNARKDEANESSNDDSE